jgi:Flp pilus assembly protein TadD
MKMLFKISRRACTATAIMLSACAAANPGSATSATGTAYGDFLAARYADARQDPQAAVHYYTQALAADPNNHALISEGFIAAVISGSPQAPALAKQVTNNALATMLLGNQAAINGNFAEAARQYALLPQNDLSGLLAPLLSAWALAGEGNSTAALATLQPHIDDGSPFGGVYALNAALIADQAHDMKDASKYYADPANNITSPNLRLAQIMASWQARQGNMAAAQAELAAMANTHPGLEGALPGLQADIAKPVINNPTDGLAEAYLTIAGSLSQPNQAVLRLTFLHFALDLRPDLSSARILLATLLAGVGNDGEQAATPSKAMMQSALDALQPIPATDPLYGPAAAQEATLMAALGQTQPAVDLINKLLITYPKDIGLLEQAGDTLRGNNQFAEAVPYYSRAIADLPTLPPPEAWTLFYDRGISIDQSGDWAKAEPDLQEALKLAPNQPYVLNYIGYTWALRGENLPKALAMLNQAASLAPNEGAIIDSLGYVNLKTGDTKQAMQLLIKAVQMSPDDAEVNAHLGDAFYADGQKLQADYQWQRALALKPDAKLQADIEAKLKQFAPPS